MNKQDTGRDVAKMKIGFGCDHAGSELREAVVSAVRALGHEIIDFGTHSQESVDYPDFAERVATAVRTGECRFGILVCGTGVGISISANKVTGVRAALCAEEYTARMSRLHNNANVLALGARVTGSGLAQAIVTAFLETDFEGGRHERRVDKISALEASK